jgi:hypothetical protein
MGLPWPDQLLWKVHSEILAGGSPFNHLLRKDTLWKWNEAQENTWQAN